jgi:Uma2 family endonuclease
MPRRFSRHEYYRMAAIGLFEGQRVELIEGEILRISPQVARHASAVTRINRLFTRAVGRGYVVRVQLPLATDDKTEPEPDIAVVRGRDRDMAERHPTSAALVIEVSESPLEYERSTKAPLYARAGASDDWIVDLVNRRLEVRRQPVHRSGEADYGLVSLHLPNDVVRPLELAKLQVLLRDPFPS